MAGKAELEIIIKAKETASATMNNIGASTANMSRQFKMAGAAVTAMGVAIAAALAMAVKAFAEEEKGIIRLSTAMRNIGLDYEANKEAIEANINALQQKTAIADSAQRDSLASLIRITRDTAGAFDLLELSMDIAVGTGRDLESATRNVMYALGGNWGEIQQLIPALKFAQTEEEKWMLLRELFAGQAEEYGKSMAGQFALLKANISDITEAIGGVLAPTVKKIAGLVADWTQKIKNMNPVLREVGVIAAVAAAGLFLIVGPSLLIMGFLPSLIAGFHALTAALGSVATMAGVTSAALLGIVGVIAAVVAGIALALYFLNEYKVEIASHIPILGRKIRAEDAYTESLRQNALANLDRMGIEHDANTTLTEATRLAKEHVAALMAQERAEKELADSIRDANTALLEQDVSALRAAQSKGKLAEAAERLGLTEQEAQAFIALANEEMTNQEIAAYAAADKKKTLEEIADELGMSERKLTRILGEANAELEKQAGISSSGGAGWSVGATIAPMPAFGLGAIVRTPTIAKVGEVPELIAPLSLLGNTQPSVTHHHYNVTIKAQALMGNEQEARAFARLIMDYARQDQRRKGMVTV